MAIDVTCAKCGRSYSLQERFAGTLVKCPNCEANIRVNSKFASDFVKVQPQADAVFERDKFLLRQKHFHWGFAEKYYVWNEQGEAILFIERPAHFLRNLMAALAGMLAGLIVWILLIGLAAVMPNAAIIDSLLMLSSMFVAIFAFVFIYIKLSQKRHVTFYRDDSKQNRLLEVKQDKKFEFLIATYTVLDANGNLLARFRKNYLYNIFRKQWKCYNADGSILCVAKEDSIVLALLRRFIGVFFGILRTNFIIVSGRTERVIGEFNRQFTLLDRYVLDLSPDAERYLDRRIAVALGVMLDTGERR